MHLNIKDKKWVYGAALLADFVLWTILIRCVDVQPVGQQGTDVGFAALNTWFHGLTGVHMTLYNITDVLGAVPFLVCLCFGALGVVQLIRRRSLARVDRDLILLGIYYAVVIAVFLAFEVLELNYRPILIEGRLEASYPSSTTLLVLSVMPTLPFQLNRRVQNPGIRAAVGFVTLVFSLFMVLGRLISGVHWLTDIVGSVIFSVGLFLLYQAAVQRFAPGQRNRRQSARRQ